MQSNVRRRHFLQWGAASLGLALVSLKSNAAEVCGVTPEQTAGPFYPGESSFVMANDLTRVVGTTAPPLGEVIVISGIVRDGDCKPVAGVGVEIWQACASGRYNNPTDPNTAPLDPNFKYWGETVTDPSGTYTFKTIIPGAYPADTDWERPPHIHFRLSKRGYHELITQMYFKGEPLNAADKILNGVPPSQREGVIIEFKPQSSDPLTKIGTFDITILRV